MLPTLCEGAFVERGDNLLAFGLPGRGKTHLVCAIGYELIQRLDPRGIPYYWIGGPPPSGISVPGTDFNAVVNRRIAVTPIHLDLTGRRLLRQLRTWDWRLESAEPDVAAAVEAAAGGGVGDAPVPSPVGEARIAEEAQIERR